jgi:peptide/nickel transport system substrate-binding protein
LEAGDAHIAVDLTGDQIASLQQNPDVNIGSGLSTWTLFLLMNMDPEVGGPMSEDAVQDAVRLALDYEGLRLLTGESAASPVNIVPVDWPYALDPSMAIQRDVEAAKAKLAEAGYGDGLDVTLEYSEASFGSVPWATLAQKVQADLNEAGFNVTLKPGELQTDLERYRNGEQAFSLWGWHPDFIDPLDRLSFAPGGNVGLRANWPEERASEELVEQVQKAWVATDPADREAAFTAVQELMLDESPFVTLVQPGVQPGYRSNVQNPAYSALWGITVYGISLEE